MSGGFFRGTSADQDTRFSNKQAKLLKSQKFAPELDHLVDMTKVKMDVMRPWIANRVTELLGFEDEVLINFIYGLLDGKVQLASGQLINLPNQAIKETIKEINGKEVQISLTGFMEKNTGKFMKELWSLLISAQKNASGVPQQFLDAKEEETRKKKAETDRIENEIQRKHEKGNRELEQEKTKKMDGDLDIIRGNDVALESSSKHHPRVSNTRAAVKETNGRNGSRGGKRGSRSPHSADRSSSTARSISKSFSNSGSYSNGRHRSRSISGSPQPRERSISSNSMHRSLPRRSVTPHRRHSPQISPSPSRRRFYRRRRSSSRSRYRSPSPRWRRLHSPLRYRLRSPVRHRSPMSYRRRSGSPVRRRSLSPLRQGSRSLTQHSPSPLQQRSPPPRRRRSRSLGRRRSPFPRRRHSPSHLRRRSPSPLRRRSPSPLHRRSRSPRKRSPSPLQRFSSSPRRRFPSPLRRRYGRSPLSPRQLSPLPVQHRLPIQRRSHTPSQLRSPSPQGSSSSSPVHQMTPSPDREISLKPQRRSPIHSPGGRIRIGEKISHVHHAPRRGGLKPVKSREGSESLDHQPQVSSKSPQRYTKVHSLSPPSRSRSVSESPPAARKRSPNRDASGCPVEKPLNQAGGKMMRSSSPSSQKLKEHRPDLESSGIKEETKYARGDVDQIVSEKRSGRVQHLDVSNQQEILTTHRGTLSSKKQEKSYPEKGYKAAEKNNSHLSNSKGSNHYDKSETRDLMKKDPNDHTGAVVFGPEKSDKHSNQKSDKHGDGVKEKRKHKKSGRGEVTSSDDYSSDSEIEDRKEAKKRRRKEEKRQRKEEKRRRREKRHRRREERRVEKLKDKSADIAMAPPDLDGYAFNGDLVDRKELTAGDIEKREFDQKRLEIELREKALESLRKKKGVGR